MGKTSAGILMYRRRDAQVEVLIVHPGGPFWKNKDAGAWSIPKGEFLPGEKALDVARREFKEELGKAASGNSTELRPVFQAGGKIVYAWAVEGDLDTTKIKSNEFEMEWPPRSGRLAKFPEVDRAEWLGLDAAREKLNHAQTGFIDQLEELLA
ncbi:MAG TPA: NUDIX domain-containing protein [Pyrinomonadaceae bacterium]|jgi:predicted NUDIX family NTP pyrophosphohydrolase